MTAFAEITGRIIAALAVDPPVSPNITRARERAMAEGWATAVNVQWDAGVPDYGQLYNAPADWQSRYTVECFAKSAAQSGDLAVDSLVDAAYERLASNPTLDGCVQWIRLVQIEAICDSNGMKTGWVGMTYQVSHRTSNYNLNLMKN